MRKVLGLALATATLGSLMIVGPAALAAGKPAGGPIKLFVTPVTSTRDKVLVTGAIGDYGSSLSVNKNGKVSPNGNYEKVTLKQGSFVVNATALNKKINATSPSINRATCSFLGGGSGQTTLAKGTGLYKGIRGTAKITVTFAGIVPRLTSGAKKGQCNFANNAMTLGEYESITGTGNVTFS